MEHLKTVGVEAEPFMGFDSITLGLIPTHTFDVNKPGEFIGVMHVGGCLSHYLLWKVLSYLPGDYFWTLEDDAQFESDWQDRYDKAMEHLPTDWDMVYFGSCCTQPKNPLGGGLYEYKYPMCTHAMQIRKKALPVLLDIHQKVWAPLDIAMTFDSLPKLKVYTILPRIVSQRGTFLIP